MKQVRHLLVVLIRTPTQACLFLYYYTGLMYLMSCTDRYIFLRPADAIVQLYLIRAFVLFGIPTFTAAYYFGYIGLSLYWYIAVCITFLLLPPTLVTLCCEAALVIHKRYGKSA